MKYARNVMIVEAFQLPSGDDTTPFHEWAHIHQFDKWTSAHHGTMDVETNGGLMSAGEGDWIVKLTDGSFTVFAADEFAKYYTAVDTDVEDGEMFRWLFGRMIVAIRHQRLRDEVGQDDELIALMEKFEQRGMAGEITLADVRNIFKEITA